jgi:hypothetical protein
MNPSRVVNRQKSCFVIIAFKVAERFSRASHILNQLFSDGFDSLFNVEMRLSMISRNSIVCLPRIFF